MDYTKFVNSRDIAEHLRAIGYRFTAPEAAFLVYQSQTATLEEKFSAWENIMETMPDCSMDERFNMKAIPCFHDFLRQYIDLQKQFLARFREPGGHVYVASCLHQSIDGDSCWEDNHSVCFSDVDKCLAFIVQDTAEYEEQDLKGLRILKLPLNERRCSALDDMYIDRQGNALSLDIHGLSDQEFDIDFAFEGMWFAFPTPFQRGDILVQKKPYGITLFVLEDLCSWNTKTCREQGVDEARASGADAFVARMAKKADSSDMTAVGYYLDGPGSVVQEVLIDYLSFERPRKPLQGEVRLLKPVSCLVKGEIGPMEFLDAYRLIMAEEHLKQVRPDLWYTDEFFEMVGSKREQRG